MKGKTILRFTGLALIGVAAAAIFCFLLGLAVKLLWNWLMPELFGLPQIGYWQAVGILALCHLLFKSHSSHHGGHKDGQKDRHRNGSFKAKVQEKLRKEDAEGSGGEPAGADDTA
jgi:hypothetical protein